MFEISFDFSDVKRACEEGQAQRIRSAQSAVKVAAEEALAQAMGRRRFKSRTGNLVGKATAGPVTTDATGGESVMSWPVSYASFVDAGTAPHAIRPRLGAGVSGPAQPGQGRRSRGRGRAFLRFEIGGRVIYARAVHHPGTRATGFAGDAAMTAERLVVREVEVGWRELEQILSR